MTWNIVQSLGQLSVFNTRNERDRQPVGQTDRQTPRDGIGLLSRRSRQRERLHATGLSICSSVRLFVYLSVSLSQIYKNAVFSKTKQFRAMVSNLHWRPIGSRTRAFLRTHYWIRKIQDGWDPPSWKSTWRHFSVEGGPIWIKFRRLVQNDMSTAMISSSSPSSSVY